MANQPYIVIRLVPDSPVDGATFGSYLDGLQIKIYPAKAPQTAATLLGTTQIALSSLSLSPLPWALGTYVATSIRAWPDHPPLRLPPFRRRAAWSP